MGDYGAKVGWDIQDKGVVGVSVVLQELKRYGLEPRVCNALWRAGILTMEALSGLTDQDVIKIRNIGDRGLLNLRGTLVNVAAGREVNPSGEIR